jgi:UDP-N-acetylmuramoyl-tripeptide--D-alanyl-D-alanine ligase
MRKLSRSELLSLLNDDGGDFVIRVNGPDFTVKGVSRDSRAIAKGCLYIALKGERYDGHDFIDSALASGAAAAISHKEYAGEKPVIVVKDTRQALTRLAGGYRRLFSPVTVALTGSVGKTTTKEMTAAVLSARCKTLKTAGNLNNEIGVPLTLLELDESYGAAVVEMGMSHAGEISRLSLLARPDIGLITNIGTSHIEFLGSRENIRKAKLELLDGLRPGGDIVLNGDDEYLKFCPESEGFHRVYYGVENPSAEVRAVNIESGSEGSRFVIVYPGGKVKAETILAGKHNIYNALAAFAVGLCAGVNAEAAAEALKTVGPEGMRQRIYTLGEVTVIEDCYNANPDSMRAALAVLNSFPRRKVALLGDMLELGDYSAKAHRELGGEAAEAADIVVAVGSFSREVAFGAKEAGMAPDKIYTPEREAAPELLKGLLRDGDVLLVKGSRGMRMEELIKRYAAMSLGGFECEDREG